MEVNKRKEVNTRLIRKLPWLLLIPLGFILPAAANRHPWAVERIYANGIYPVIRKITGGSMRIFRFSFAEFFVYGVILATVALLIFNLVRLLLKKTTPMRFLSFLVSLAVFAGVMFNLFYFLWGFNYSRPTLYEIMELDVKARPEEELQRLSASLILTANRLREQVEEDENGVFTIENYRKAFDEIPDAYKALGRKHGIFSEPAYPAKGVLNSVGMSWAGISGIFMPYTGEANVNIHQPPLLLLSSAAHENAHSLGFAREDEANFISYLACVSSDNPAIAYSGVMLAMINCTNKLSKTAPEKFLPLRELYSDAILRDLADYNRYWVSYEGAVEEAFNSMNDGYLKFNNQDNGIKSYGMMVDLLLAYYAQ